MSFTSRMTSLQSKMSSRFCKDCMRCLSVAEDQRQVCIHRRIPIVHLSVRAICGDTKKCPLLVRGNESTCKWCLSLSVTLRVRIQQKRATGKKNGTRPTKRFRFTSVRNSDSMLALRRARNALKRSKERLLKRVKVLSEGLKQARAKMQNMSTEVLDQKQEALKQPSAQLELIKECVLAARCKSKMSRRCTEHWILICLLLHIRSPSGYSFLKDNEILPLPCVTTVRKYLSMVRMK
ncbi:unnamed protein product, partial [Ixodes persulcatus]